MTTSSISNSSSSSSIFSVQLVEPSRENIFLSMDSFRELESDLCSLHNVVLMSEIGAIIQNWLDQDPNSIDPTIGKLLMKYFGTDDHPVHLPDHLKSHLELFEKEAVDQFRVLTFQPTVKLQIDLFKEALSHLQNKLAQHCKIETSKVPKGLLQIFLIPCFKALDNTKVGEIIKDISEKIPTPFSIGNSIKESLGEEKFSNFSKAILREKDWLKNEDETLNGQLNDPDPKDPLYEFQCIFTSLIKNIRKTQIKQTSHLEKFLSENKNNPKICNGKILIVKDLSNDIFFRTIIKETIKTKNKFEFRLANKKIVKVTFSENKETLSITQICIDSFKETSFLQLIDKFPEMQKNCSVRFPDLSDYDEGRPCELTLIKTPKISWDAIKNMFQEFLGRIINQPEGSLTTIQVKETYSDKKIHILSRYCTQKETIYSYSSLNESKKEALTANDFSLFKMIEKETHIIKIKETINDSVLLEEKSLDKNSSLQEADTNIRKIEEDIICNSLVYHPDLEKWICKILNQTFSINSFASNLQKKLEEIQQIHKEYFKSKIELVEIFTKILFDAYYVKICVSAKKIDCLGTNPNYLKSLNSLNRMRLLKQAIDYLEGIKGKKGIFVIGYTGAGKSAAAGSLANGVVKIDGYGNAVYEKPNDNLPIIGHASGVSQTIFAQGYPVKRDLAIIDCPGFLETKGIDYQLCTSISLDRAFNEISSIQACVILASYHSIIADRSSHFYSLIDIISKRFGGFFSSNSSDFPDNIFILVTKCQGIHEEEIKTLDQILDGSYFSEMCCDAQDVEPADVLTEQVERNSVWRHLAKMGEEGKISPLIFEKSQLDVKRREVDLELAKRMRGKTDLLNGYIHPFKHSLKSLNIKMDYASLTALKDIAIQPFQTDWNNFCEHREYIKKKKKDCIDERGRLNQTLDIQTSEQTKEKQTKKEKINELNLKIEKFQQIIDAEYTVKKEEALDNALKEGDKKEACEKHVLDLSKERTSFKLPFIFTTTKWLENELSPGWIIPVLIGTITRDEYVEIDFKFDLEALRDYEIYLLEDPEELNDIEITTGWSLFRTISDLFSKRVLPKEFEDLTKKIAHGENPFSKQDLDSSSEDHCSFAYNFNDRVALQIEGKNFQLTGVSLSGWDQRKLLFKFRIFLSNQKHSEIRFNCSVSNRRLNLSKIKELENEAGRHSVKKEQYKTEADEFVPKINHLMELIKENKSEIEKIKGDLEENFNASNTPPTNGKLSKINSLIKLTTGDIYKNDQFFQKYESEEIALDAIYEKYKPLAQTVKQLQEFYPEITLKEFLQSTNFLDSSSKEHSEPSGKGKEEEI